jgi:uncharacterized protein (UPF0332 family)
MTYKELQDNGLIEKITILEAEIKDLVEIAKRDISTAEFVMAHDVDWALTITYNSVHQVLLAVMYQEGFRPKGDAKHKATIDFCRIALGGRYKTEIDVINKLRKKRNTAVYQHIKTASELEAKEAIKFAKDFVSKVVKERKL